MCFMIQTVLKSHGGSTISNEITRINAFWLFVKFKLLILCNIVLKQAGPESQEWNQCNIGFSRESSTTYQSCVKDEDSTT